MDNTTEPIQITYRNTSLALYTDKVFQHSHLRYEIYYFHEGDCKYVINDDVMELEKNDIIIMNGSTLHGPYPKQGISYVRSVIEFSAEWIDPILQQLHVPMLLEPFEKLHHFLLRGVDQATLDKIVSIMKELDVQKRYLNGSTLSETERNLLKGQMIHRFIGLLFIIYELSYQKLQHTPIADDEKTRHVNRLIAWVDQNFQRTITLNEIADTLHLSKYYVSRIFKDITGQTIMQYLMNRRLTRAKYLLEIYPDKPMMDISMESGFESPSHFSRKFKTKYQISPTAYRNRRLLE
ncbi:MULTISPECIES: AraC family transcriptional regulator [Gracilibacillus]|uniref:AraC family transcriptional regulator n=1 Tax=Gracilibacillus TaxID=74385 RepID=UPI0008270FCD|nr:MULTISPECIES: AraC family transcriptional regulator [Gracilibacillus]